MRKKTRDEIQSALTEGGTLSGRKAKLAARRGQVNSSGRVEEKTRKGTRVLRKGNSPEK